jgi:Tol biopolymer transport system component
MIDQDLEIKNHLSRIAEGMSVDVEGSLTDLHLSARPQPARGLRIVTIAVALLIAAAGIALVARAFLRSSATSVGGSSSPHAILFTRWGLTPEETGFPNPRIWFASADGALWGLMPQPPGDNKSAVWSPDGSKVAFVNRDNTDHHLGLWVMNEDGSGLRDLAEGFGADEITWAPDGTEIAFAGEKDPDPETAGRRGIWIVPVSEGEPTLVVSGDYSQPAWSPDGTRLLVVGPGTNDATNLYVVATDGSGLAPLTGDGAAYTNPQWSPDGRQIALARNAHPYEWNWDVYLMDADGSNMWRLTAWKGWDSAPVWSPDGGQIAFTSDRDASPQELSIDERQLAGERGLAVYVMKADGTDVRLVFADDAMQTVPTSWRS